MSKKKHNTGGHLSKAVNVSQTSLRGNHDQMADDAHTGWLGLPAVEGGSGGAGTQNYPIVRGYLQTPGFIEIFGRRRY